jgi:hypothetical protein
VNFRISKLKQATEILRAVGISGMLGGNLASLLLLYHPKEALSNIQYGLFGWRMISKQGLPIRQLHELVDVPECVSIEFLPKTSYLTYWDANYTKDVMYLALLTKALSPKTIFEIGTLHGYTALLFALNSPAQAEIYSLDLPFDGSVPSSLSTTLVDDHHIAVHTCSDYLYNSYPTGTKVRQLYGDSAQFDFTPFKEKVNLFFIDGAHSYDYVRSDTLNALTCVQQGGVIVWHDYGRWGVNGVSRWLHELRYNGKDVCRLPGSSLAILRI